jgi:hypothetical protein
MAQAGSLVEDVLDYLTAREPSNMATRIWPAGVTCHHPDRGHPGARSDARLESASSSPAAVALMLVGVTPFRACA